MYTDCKEMLFVWKTKEYFIHTYTNTTKKNLNMQEEKKHNFTKKKIRSE